MRYCVIVLALALNVALVKSQGPAASGQTGGCSVGASGTGSADGMSGSAEGSASVNCATPAPGYTYVINATRTENVIAPGYPVLYMYYEVTPTQNLTYFTTVGPENPILLEGYMYNDDTVYYQNDEDHLLNTCDKQPDGTWQYVLNEIATKSILLGHDCSVKKGNYMINQTVDPITVTLPEMIKCGENEVIFNGYTNSGSSKKLTWAFQLYFTFQIDNNCD